MSLASSDDPIMSDNVGSDQDNNVRVAHRDVMLSFVPRAVVELVSDIMLYRESAGVTHSKKEREDQSTRDDRNRCGQGPCDQGDGEKYSVREGTYAVDARGGVVHESKLERCKRARRAGRIGQLRNNEWIACQVEGSWLRGEKVESVLFRSRRCKRERVQQQ